MLLDHVCMTLSLLLLNHPLDAIEQNSTLSSQFSLTILASTPRLCHCFPESFSFLDLLSSFSLRVLVGGTTFFGFAFLALGGAMLFCEGDDLLTAAVVNAVKI